MCDVDPDYFEQAAMQIATEECPRCGTLGLHRIDEDEFLAAPADDRLVPEWMTTLPAVHVQCPGCQMVSRWPDMVEHRTAA